MSSIAIAFIALVGIMVVLARMLCTVALYRKSSQMRKKEKQMNADGITPYGSGLSHGIVIDEERKFAVKPDSKPSRAWYSRLV